jgi:DNA polymerase III subunit beta
MMKFTIEREIFVDGLQKIQSVLDSNPAQPILNNVLIIAEKDSITLKGTDSLITVICKVEAHIEKKGITGLPARRLFGLVRELPDHHVTVEVDDKHVASIQSAASSMRLFGIAPDDFPEGEKIRTEKQFSIDQDAFKQMLSKTVYAVSYEESRYILNGVLLKIKDQKISAVATDGRRLAVVEQEIEVLKDLEGDVVIPTKAVNEVLKCMSGEGKLNIIIDSNRIMFEIDGVHIISNLIKGEYPNYQQVIPTHFDERVTVERESLLAGIKRASLMTSDRYPSIKMRFINNLIQISAVTPDVGEAFESVPVKYSGKEIFAAFNPELFTDPLRNLSSDEVYLEMIDDISPIVIKCDIPFLYVVMPLRID